MVKKWLLDYEVCRHDYDSISALWDGMCCRSCGARVPRLGNSPVPNGLRGWKRGLLTKSPAAQPWRLGWLEEEKEGRELELLSQGEGVHCMDDCPASAGTVAVAAHRERGKVGGLQEI